MLHWSCQNKVIFSLEQSWYSSKSHHSTKYKIYHVTWEIMMPFSTDKRRIKVVALCLTADLILALDPWFSKVTFPELKEEWDMRAPLCWLHFTYIRSFKFLNKKLYFQAINGSKSQNIESMGGRLEEREAFLLSISSMWCNWDIHKVLL